MTLNSPTRLIAPSTRRRILVATALAGVLATAGCVPSAGGGPSDKETASASPSSSTEAPSASPTSPEASASPTAEPTADSSTRSLTIPKSGLGVQLTASVPVDWEDGMTSGEYYAKSPTPFGDPPFSANLTVTSETLPAGATLDMVATNVKDELTSMAGWSSTQSDGVNGTVSGHDAFRLSGRAEPAGAGRLAVSVTAVMVETTDGTVVVFLKGLTSTNDTDAQEAISGILDSVVIS